MKKNTHREPTLYIVGNEEMAIKIATDYTNQQLTIMKRREMCIEMAEWKDEQFEKLLPELMICAQQGYVQCASDDVTIKEMSKILKGESNEK